MSIKEASSAPEFKAVFVGDSSVGKTSIIMRHHHGSFSEDRQSTIGAGFVSEDVKTQYGTANLHIWDTAGQERYRCLVPMYSRGSNVAIVVFDVTDKVTFEGVDSWIERLKSDIGEQCKIIVAGNKSDLSFSQELRDEYDNWSSKSDYPLIYVSAKTGESIDILFQEIINSLPKAPFLVNQPVVIEEEEKKSCC